MKRSSSPSKPRLHVKVARRLRKGVEVVNVAFSCNALGEFEAVNVEERLELLKNVYWAQMPCALGPRCTSPRRARPK